MTVFGDVLRRTLWRMPLVAWTLMIGFLVGGPMWLALDWEQTRLLRGVFEDEASQRLRKQAVKDRQRFYNSVSSFKSLARVLAHDSRLRGRISVPDWAEEGVGGLPVVQDGMPDWVPRRSVIRTFPYFDFVVLLDAKGRVREVYTPGAHPLPEALRQPSMRLVAASAGQSLLTEIDGMIHVVASEKAEPLPGYEGASATLLIASRIDDNFFVHTQGLFLEEPAVVALVSGTPPAVIASSNPDAAPDGARLRDLKDEYLEVGQAYLDFGASETYIGFVSLIPRSYLSDLAGPVTTFEREQRTIVAIAFLVLFLVVVMIVGARVRAMTQRVSDVSEEILGTGPKDRMGGDELRQLEGEVERLGEEVLAYRESLIREAERIRRKLEEQNIVATLMRLALSNIALNELLNKALPLILSSPYLEGVSAGCIFMRKGERLAMVAGHGMVRSVMEGCAEIGLGECLCGRTVESGEAIFTDNHDERHEFHHAETATHGHYCIPIKSADATLGVITLYVGPDAERDADAEQFFDMVADSLAGVIQRKTAENDLLEAHAMLELRVEERTRELSEEVSERRRAEAALRASSALLRQTNKELENFAYIISHDLRSPLTSIKGFGSELVGAMARVNEALPVLLSAADEETEKAIRSDLYEVVPEALGYVNAAAEKMESLVNGILRLSRLGKRELSFEPVDAAEVVRANVDALAFQIEGKGVAVEVGDMPTVVSDRLALEQIFGNLLGNAVKFMAPGRPGRINVWAEDKAADGVVFHVRDNGRGIDERDQERVFGVFQRVGDRDTEGEGMGLAFVQTMARRLGGAVSCRSKKDEGSTFSVTLPSAATEETPS